MFKNVFTKYTNAAAIALLTATAYFALGGTADAASMGDLFCNAFTNTKAFAFIFQYAAYVAGVFCVVRGIHHLRLHTDRPTENSLARPLMLWLGGACLLALPSVIDCVIASIYGASASGGALVCGAPGMTGGASTLDVMLANFVGNIKAPLISLVSLIAIVAGLFMVVNGLVKASKHGIDARTYSVHSILTNIVFGALLMTIGDNLNVMLASVFGDTTLGTSSVINWSYAASLAGGASAQFQTAVTAALTFVQIIGVIAFVRGWLVMKKVVEGGGNVTMAQGITHIVGGVLAINVFSFLEIMNSTFGTQLFN